VIEMMHNNNRDTKQKNIYQEKETLVTIKPEQMVPCANVEAIEITVSTIAP
jgi:hypothetical protein